MLNDQFQSVFTREINCDISQLPRVQDVFIVDQKDVLCDIDINKDIVFKYLKKLKLNKAPEPDDLVPKVLVETAKSICDPLSKFFCKSIHDGIVPDEWKKANVVPFLKRGLKVMLVTTDQLALLHMCVRCWKPSYEIM